MVCSPVADHVITMENCTVCRVCLIHQHMGAHNFGQDKVQIPLRTADLEWEKNYTSQAKDVFVKKKKT